MRALVVGADGFVGRWLIRHLTASGDSVSGVVGPRYRPPLNGVESVFQVDVRDHSALQDAVSASSPDSVYYLAAISARGGRDDVASAAGIAVAGAINALSACADLGNAVTLLYVSSAHVYGESESSPISETAPVRPTTVYGASKAAAEAALLHMAPVVRTRVVIARPFNHIGPGQRAPFLVPTLVDQVRRILTAGGGSIRVGAPETVRDYTDVRDVVRAYRLLIESGESGSTYNVASGRGVSVREMAESLLSVAGASAELVVDDPPERGHEPRELVGDAAKLERLGWRREYGLRETLRDVLDG